MFSNTSLLPRMEVLILDVIPFVYAFFDTKTFIRKQGSKCQNLKEILENDHTQFPKISDFIGQKSICCHYCILYVKGIQI